LKRGESEGLQQLNWSEIKKDENGRAYVSGKGLLIINVVRSLPFFGSQLPTYWAAADNPYWQKGATQGMFFMMQKLMGVEPRYQHPERDLSFPVRERKLSLEKARGVAEDRVRQQEWERYQKRKGR